tara:strand:+ start:2971 stop:3435 length:465 start_codon:yes stop_codon:yes gene_type:complete
MKTNNSSNTIFNYDNVNNEKENGKVKENGNVNNDEDKIIINFPYSCHSVTMSYNDAIQSGYINSLFSFNNNDDEKAINIQKDLYIGIRKFDLIKLIDLWLGNTEVYEHDRTKYCYKTIYRVADALLMNKELPFMMEFYKKYNKEDIIENLNQYK